MAGEAVLVIDVGTGGAKCLLIDVAGQVIFKQARPIRFRFEGGGADFDPAQVWLDICAMTREASRWASKAGIAILSATSTSMREGNVLYDGDGKELLALPNIDGRAFAQGQKIAASAGELIYQTSGHWPSAMFLASRLKWLSEGGGESLRKVRRASMINDWVIFRLTRKLLTEPTNGCETTLFDIKKRSWSGEVIQELGVDASLLPEVVECGTVVGTLSKAAIEETSLPASVVATVGAADTEGALAGCGVFDLGRVVAVAGTTTPIQAVVDSPVTDPKGRTWTCCHVIPGRWAVESNAGATGMFFDWWARTTGKAYGELDAGASKLPPGSNGVRIVTGLSLFNARGFPQLRTRMENMGPWTEPQVIARAVIESACYAVRANLEQIEGVLGASYEEMTFCGGSAMSELWSQLQADVLNIRLSRFMVGDATARGAAMLSFVAMNRFPDLSSAAGKMAKDQVVVKPLAGNAAAYGPLYESWLSDTLRLSGPAGA